jgi:Na+-translocating ferredoxin:NAD+ oxidoreductase subunit G
MKKTDSTNPTNSASSITLKNIFLSTALLGIFGLVGTAMVVGVNHITRDQIEKNDKANLLKSLNNIIASDSYNNNLLATTIVIPASPLLGKERRKEQGKDKPTTVYQAWMDKEPTAIAFDIVATDGFSGKIKLLIAIKKNAEVSAVRVISHKETPGLGDKIEIKRSQWITSFNGKSLENTAEKNWQVKKDNGIYDQFTGATITPRAIVKAVHKALIYYKKNQQFLFLTQQEYDLSQGLSH